MFGGLGALGVHRSLPERELLLLPGGLFFTGLHRLDLGGGAAFVSILVWLGWDASGPAFAGFMIESTAFAHVWRAGPAAPGCRNFGTFWVPADFDGDWRGGLIVTWEAWRLRGWLRARLFGLQRGFGLPGGVCKRGPGLGEFCLTQHGFLQGLPFVLGHILPGVDHDGLLDAFGDEGSAGLGLAPDDFQRRRIEAWMFMVMSPAEVGRTVQPVFEMDGGTDHRGSAAFLHPVQVRAATLGENAAMV